MKASLWRLMIHGTIALAAVAVIAQLVSGDHKDIDSINRFVSTGARKLLDYATVVAAVGTVAMAVIELIKALGDVRRFFHEWRLWLWIRDEDVLQDLLFLAIGDRSRSDALCGQPLEKMMGQIQAASHVALDFPAEHPALYEFLTMTDVPKANSRLDQAAEDRDFWRYFAGGKRQPLQQGVEPRRPDPEEQEAARARLRLSNLVSRKLDGFQLRTQYYWDRSNQLAAVIASIAIMSYALTLAELNQGITLNGLLLGLLSGALAPFAKDLTRGLAQFGKA